MTELLLLVEKKRQNCRARWEHITIKDEVDILTTVDSQVERDFLCWGSQRWLICHAVPRGRVTIEFIIQTELLLRAKKGAKNDYKKQRVNTKAVLVKLIHLVTTPN